MATVMSHQSIFQVEFFISQNPYNLFQSSYHLWLKKVANRHSQIATRSTLFSGNNFAIPTTRTSEKCIPLTWKQFLGTHPRKNRTHLNFCLSALSKVNMFCFYLNSNNKMCSQPTQLIKALCGLASFMIRCIYWTKGNDYRIRIFKTFFHIFLPKDSQNLFERHALQCSDIYQKYWNWVELKYIHWAVIGKTLKTVPGTW